MGAHHKQKKKCGCEWQKEECHECAPKRTCECEKPKKEHCECEKCSEPKKEPCCNRKEKCCPEFIVGPIGPRGPRGPGPITLPYGFVEIPSVVLLPVGMLVVLSVTLNSIVTRDLRIISAASPHSLIEGNATQLLFQLRIDGVIQNNGAGSTLNRDFEGREQREAISLVRRQGPFPPGPRTVDLIVTTSNSGASLDPLVGGATLLVEQIPV